MSVWGRVFGLLLVVWVGLVWPISAAAGQKIRMYQINGKLQQRKITIGKAATRPGCHDLLWGKHIYRVAQVGFGWCSLYTKEACDASSIVTAYWSDGVYHKYNIESNTPQEKLYPGAKWIMDAAADDVQSWYCEAQ